MDQKIPGSKTFLKRIKISGSYVDWNGSKFLTCRIGVNLQEKTDDVKKLIYEMFPNPQQKWVLRWMSHWTASIDVAVGATIGWVLKQLTQDRRIKKP